VSGGSGAGAGGDGPATAFSASTNGRWVAFSSRASDLVPGDTNQVEDVFLRDVESGITRRVSQASTGAAGNAESLVPLISADGRWVVFESAATNLTSTVDTNRTYDVFLWDRERDRITAISVGMDGTAASGTSNAEVLGRDGGRVVFRSAATNLVPAGTDIQTDLFVWSRLSGEVRRIELPGPRPSDLPIPVSTFNPVLSADGRCLAFRTRTALAALGPGDGVWWMDLQSGTPAVRISGDLLTGRPVGLVDGSGPVMSEDGQRVAFEAQNASTEPRRIRLWSPVEGLRTLDGWVTGGEPGLPEPASSWSPVLSPDGTLLAFQTDAAVPAAGVGSAGGSRFHVRVLATGETRTLFPALDFDTPLPAPVFSPDGKSLLFQTATVLPGIADLNRANDIFWTPVTLDRVELVSRRHADRPVQTGMGTSAVGPWSLSDDGRRLVFSSTADNLVPNDANGRRDVFVRDLASGTSQLVSVGLDGKSPAADSWQPRISADGRQVVFVSMGTNLVAGEHAPQRAVYVRDLVAGTTLLASARDAGIEGASHGAFNPQISADGGTVLFESGATNLVEGALGSNPRIKLFVRILASQRTFLASSSLSPESAGESSGTFAATLDARGGRVVFLSGGNPHEYRVGEEEPRRLAAGTRSSLLSLSRDGTRLAMLGSQDTANFVTLRTVSWHDLVEGTNRLVAIAPTSQQNRFGNVSISADGRLITFDSNFAPPGLSDTNRVRDVFTFDIASGALSLASSAMAGGVAGNGASDSPVLSADGQRVVFRSEASDLVAGDTNNASDIFIRDRVTEEITRLSRRLDGLSASSGRASNPHVSSDGRVVIFQSRAADLVQGDFNRGSDVFASVFPPEAPTLFEVIRVTETA